jgi:CDP-diacylglycerol---glycerol-3-phosphate 3-phosphatidyltransferase
MHYPERVKNLSISSPSPNGSQIWNVPNQISMVRLGLSLLLFAALTCEQFLAAFVLFIVAAGSDWIDGWWARRFQQITQLGRILDPFCDKVLICGTFVLLAVAMHGSSLPAYAKITGWMAVVVLARELLVTALRSFMEQHGSDFSAKMAGKLKMWFQSIAAGAGLLTLVYLNGSPPHEPPQWLVIVLTLSVWLAVVSTVQSAIGYISTVWQVLPK